MSGHCRYHCRAAGCGSHFASLEAFDLHRAGDHAVKRTCVDPDEVDRLAVGTSSGVCRLTNPPNEISGVVVYVSARHAEDREGAVLRLRSAERTAEGDRDGLDLRAAA